MAWLSGSAKCRACGHKWAVACRDDANIAEMECPACGVEAGEMPPPPECLKCGECCFANGLIPPLVPGDPEDDAAPEWLRVMVDNLRGAVGDIAEGFHCLFLAGDMTCVIHAMPWRPAVCRTLRPGACPGWEREAGE